MEEITIHAELIDYNTDLYGYTIYVFRNLEYTDWTNKYIMCVRVPNWEHSLMKLNTQGYLTYKPIEAGTTEWYDRTKGNKVKYRYTFIQFIRFIAEIKDNNEEILI